MHCCTARVGYDSTQNAQVLTHGSWFLDADRPFDSRNDCEVQMNRFLGLSTIGLFVLTTACRDDSTAGGGGGANHPDGGAGPGAGPVTGGGGSGTVTGGGGSGAEGGGGSGAEGGGGIASQGGGGQGQGGSGGVPPQGGAGGGTGGAPIPDNETDCDDTLDNDQDLDTDCADTDCAAFPACIEACADLIDNNGNGAIDCEDASCDAQACDANGSVCTGFVCMCPGGPEATCDDNSDNDCDGLIDCADGDCGQAPNCLPLGVSAVDYPVITHGGRLIITGNGFTGATSVTIGAVAQGFFVDSDTQITIPVIHDFTPVGAGQDLIVTVGVASTPAFDVTPIHLLINEIDADTPGTDALEFIELSTGVVGANLTGYTLVFFNGSSDQSYFALDLNAVTAGNGQLLVGNSAVTPAPQITLANNFLQNGPDAVAVFQAPAAGFPNNTPVSAMRLIDTVVYDTNDPDDAALMDVLYGVVGTPGRVQVDEGPTPTSESQSIQRCGDGRRRGDKFGTVAPPTPGAQNGGVVCP